MASIRITTFGGINTEVAARNSEPNIATVAHNCLLWDGTLRPTAKWQSNQGGLNQRYTLEFDGTNLYTINLERAQLMKTAQYVKGTVIGLNPFVVDNDRSNICYQNAYTQIDQVVEVGVTPPVVSTYSGIAYTRQFASNKPVSKLYACSLVRNNNGRLEESPLALIPQQDPNAQLYEGDTATLTVRISDAPVRENCYLRIYRAMSSLDTGHAVENKFDTEWYLIAEVKTYVAFLGGVFREYVYIDTASVTNNPLDLYLAGHFYAPNALTYNFLTQTEGGWLVAATTDGQMTISERYMTHAWPTENIQGIPGTITDMKSSYDNVYIGTTGKPYIASLAMGEGGLQVGIKPFHEDYACLPGTMTKAAGGVLYASAAGVVSLNQDGMRLVTAGVASGIRPLYHAEYTDTSVTPNVDACTDVNFADTTYGTYFRGTYFGFMNPPINGGLTLSIGYMFDTGSSIDGSHPIARLSTFDYPAGKVLSSVITNDGMAVLANNAVWTMPLPNMPNKNSYAQAAKNCYVWRSKKYVFPGLTTFGALKVVHKCDGFVRVKVYCDEVCVYDTNVPSNKPLTLPPSIVGIEWQLEVHGNATVHEIHMASSTTDLIEQKAMTQ